MACLSVRTIPSESALQTGIDAGRLASLEAGRQAPSGDELLNLLRNRVLSFRSRLGLNPCRILEWAQVDFQSDIPEPGSDWERVAWAVGNLLQEMA